MHRSTHSASDADVGHEPTAGHWAPNRKLEYPPVFIWPPRLWALLHWFIRGYILPWNLLYALVAILFYFWLSPSAATTQSLSPGWIAAILARNALLVLLFFGLWHARLYVQRKQGTAFKFNRQWPEQHGTRFLFGQQTRDNVFWTFVSAVPIWTAIESIMLWAHSNGFVTNLSFEAHPVLFVLMMLAVPAFRDLHFYVTHRLLHNRFLYRYVHRLHHNNTNPGPWSGLSMHPIEHLLYFTGVFIHFIIPAHPLHILYQLVHAGMSPAAGHVGFERIVFDKAGKPATLNLASYNHYLHHKHFECNYANGIFPLDKWFGTFNDGSPEAFTAMRERMKRRRISNRNTSL